MFDDIKDILLEQLDIDEKDININSRILEDLGADSLDFLEIMTEIENKYNISISKDELKNVHTIKDIMEYIEKKKYEK